MKLTKQSNFRVVLPIDSHPWIAPPEKEEKYLHDYAVDQAKAIKRHLDLDHIPQIESTEVCAFCEYEWASAIDENGKPACCDKAISEWEANQPDSQQFGAGA